MSALYFLEDAGARELEPFTLTRPACELRAGAELIRKRWEKVTGARCAGFVGSAHLAGFDEGGTRYIPNEETIPAGSLVVNSRFAVRLDQEMMDAESWYAADQCCASRVRQSVSAEKIVAEGMPAVASGERGALEGRWISAPWELIGSLESQLMEDLPELSRGVEKADARIDVIGTHAVVVEKGAKIEPYVLFEASDGPILIRRGTTISAFTRITGPCYIGEDTIIVGDRITKCSIGEVSKIRGEISSTIVLGHSNKGHTGFVGHSYLGRWVNLGAGTTTSNLKNTYGPIGLLTSDGPRETRMMYLGSLIGDHAKTGIGTMLNTGTIVGAGANVFGAMMPSKYVPPFAWGNSSPYGVYAVDRFLEVVERVMARRHVSLSPGMRQQLERAHQRAVENRGE